LDAIFWKPRLASPQAKPIMRSGILSISSTHQLQMVLQRLADDKESCRQCVILLCKTLSIIFSALNSTSQIAHSRCPSLPYPPHFLSKLPTRYLLASPALWWTMLIWFKEWILKQSNVCRLHCFKDLRHISITPSSECNEIHNPILHI
jgi:hypothetical protein